MSLQALACVLRCRTDYRREAERHYQVLNDHLESRSFIAGDRYTIADMSAWGWPGLARFMDMMNARPAVSRAHAIMDGHAFKVTMDEDARRAMYPTSFPA